MSVEPETAWQELVRAGFAGSVYLEKIDFQKSFSTAKSSTGAFSGSGLVPQEKSGHVPQALIASLSKAFTGMAIRFLFKQNKLIAHDPLARFLEAPSAFQSVTVQNLLQHTSGLTDSLDRALFEDLDREREPRAVLERYLALHPPVGERRFAYANMNYSFLAAIVEQVTGRCFESAIRELILRPLDLSETRFLSEPEVLTPGCELLKPLGREPFTAPFDWLGYKGSDGILSTTRDLVRFMKGLVLPALAKDFASDTAHSCAAADLAHHLYGFGWYFELAPNSSSPTLRSLWHGGASWPEAYLSYVKYDVERELLIVLLSHSPDAQEPIGNFIATCSAL